MTFTVVTSCEDGHVQRFDLFGCSRAWVKQMVGLLEAGACNHCGAKVGADVRETEAT